MARLRFDNLFGTLGAALTSGGTTFTFASPPTYGQGVALPEIASPDVLPISADPGTSSYERMWITAYAGGGATTCTVLRGQEGTSGVAHSIGATWGHDPAVADLVPPGLGLMLPGQYYTNLFDDGAAHTTTAATLNEVDAAPILVANSVTVSSLVYRVASATASAVLRIGLYADTGHGYPGNLIQDFGTGSAAGAGNVTLTVSQVLTPGLYWIAACNQGAVATFFTFAPALRAGAPMPWNGANVNFGLAGYYAQAGVSGALPSSFSATPTQYTNSTGAPRVLIGV